MKNLKKVLALALVFAMTLTLFAGAAFTDQASIGVDYVDDVNMLVELGVLKGYENGEFRPENNVTRAEFAKMAYTLKYGADDQGLLFSGSPSAFSDVEGVSSVAWAKGYINYCANQKIIAGVGNGKFNPGGNVTVAEAAKMLLVILGCNPQTEGFVGANWQGNVVAKAIALGVFDGWSGNPTQPATRQLVAKLMRNTVFAPIYIYSPITGAGSQNQVLKPEEKNPTLGEETMGLKHITGIVVANENHKIETDAEGEKFYEVVNNSVSALTFASRKDTTTIAYLDDEVHTDGNFYWNKLVLEDYDMSDDKLGSLVDVYYKHQTKSENSKIQLIGEVLVNSKTVVYDVAAKDIEFMPNKTEKKGSYEPYIKATTADGEEIIIESLNDNVAEVNANKDYLVDYAASVDADFFGSESIFYQFGSGSADNLIDDAAKHLTSYKDNSGNVYDMVADMGEYVPTTYRLVSLDGGESISYIFCNPYYVLASKPAYNETKGTVVINGQTLEVGEEVEVYEGFKKGDTVVATYANGKYVLQPTGTVTGAATNIAENSAVINGETYYGSSNLCGSNTLAQWYAGNGQTYRRGATYITCGNLLLDVDNDAEVVVSLDNYAVVLESKYNANTEDTQVRLGFADGTSATYYVTKHVDGTSVVNLEKDDPDALQAYYEGNALLGAIVEYKVVGGKAQIEKLTSGNIKTAASGSVNGDMLTVTGNGQYCGSVGSVLFMLYNNNGSSKVQFKTYKLEDLEASNLPATAVNYKDKTNTQKTMTFVNAMLTSNNSSDVLLGVMSAGNQGVPNVGTSDDNVGLIVDSRYYYDFDAAEEYLELAVLSFTEKAIITGKYEDDLTSVEIGSLTKQDSGKEVIGAGLTLAIDSVVSYAHDGTDFTGLTSRATQNDMHSTTYTAPGTSTFHYVTVADTTSKRVTFWKYGDTSVAATTTLPVHEYAGMTSISVVDGEIVGEEIEEISKSDMANFGGASEYNAIIEVLDGQIIKVISFQGKLYE